MLDRDCEIELCEVMIVAEFVTLPAFRHLGVQIVLLAMLSGMLAGGMAFDCASGPLASAGIDSEG